MEQVFFNVPLSKLEPIFKRWIKEAQSEIEQPKFANTEKPEQFLTIQEAADFMSLSVPTMYSKVSRSEIPVMKRGKRLYFSLKELTEYLRNGKKKTTAEIEAEADLYLAKNIKSAAL